MQLCFCVSIYRNRSKNIDVMEVNRVIYEAETAQDQANDALEAASQNTDMTRNQVANVKSEKNNRFPSAADMVKHHLSACFR